MDWINHGVQGFISHYFLVWWLNPILGLISGIIGFFLGIAPDVVSYFKPELYTKIHNGEIWKWYKYTPAGYLHLSLDKISHGEDKRWYAGRLIEYFIGPYKEMMWLESITWGINIIGILLIIKTLT